MIRTAYSLFTNQIRHYHPSIPQLHRFAKFIQTPAAPSLSLQNKMLEAKNLMKDAKKSYNSATQQTERNAYKELICSSINLLKECQKLFNANNKLLEELEGSKEDQPKIRECFDRSEHIKSIKNSNCGLILASSSNKEGEIQYPHKSIANVNNIGLTSIFMEVSSLEEAERDISIIKSNQNSIKLLFILAHGNPLTMAFGTNENPVLAHALDRPLNALLKKVDQNGIVVLHSCSVGKDTIIPCIARILSYKHPRLKFVAPLCDIKICQTLVTRPGILPNSELGLITDTTRPADCAIFQRGFRITS